MKIVVRQHSAARDHDRVPQADASKAAAEALNFDNDFRAARGQQWRIPHELDGVAETLLGVKQNGLAARDSSPSHNGAP